MTLSFASSDIICLSKKKRAASPISKVVEQSKKLKSILKKSVQFSAEDILYVFTSEPQTLEIVHVEKQTRPSPLIVPDDGEDDKNVVYVTKLKNEIKRLCLINKKQEQIILLLSDIPINK